jgi:ATP-dependent RNA helicase DDX3X
MARSPYTINANVLTPGSGKTAAYLIPVISRLCGKAKKLCAPRPNQADPNYDSRINRVKAEPLVVIVVPTHELAMQVFDECRRLCYRTMMRPFATYGGQPMSITIDQLGRGCDILVATPGRLCDLMRKPDVLTMSRVMYTIIDEADEMLNMDWEDDLKMIMAGGDTNDDADHVYLMFSATFSKEMRALARQYMALGEDYRLTVGRAGSSHKNIAQDVIFVDRNKKLQACYDLIFAGEVTRTLIFCNSKRTVDELDAFLYNHELPSTSIHSDRGQREREDSMRAFRSGRAPIMITTGITARGLDVAGIGHVINYDLPSRMHGGLTEYVHRIGRTARIGNKGKATSFYDESRDEEMAQPLVNILLESGCPVPDFLEHLIPEGGVASFEDDDSDDEEEEAEGEQGGGAFGGADASTGGAAAGGFAAASAWGAPPAAADDSFSAAGAAPTSNW